MAAASFSLAECQSSEIEELSRLQDLEILVSASLDIELCKLTKTLKVARSMNLLGVEDGISIISEC